MPFQFQHFKMLREVQCSECICEIKDAIDVIDVHLIPGCSKPKLQRYEIIGRSRNPISVFQKVGCCNDSVFIEYEKGEFENTDNLTTFMKPYNETDTTEGSQRSVEITSDTGNLSNYVTRSIPWNSWNPRKEIPSSDRGNTLQGTLLSVGPIVILLLIITTIFMLRKAMQRKRTKRRSLSVHNIIYNETDTEYSTIADVNMEAFNAENTKDERQNPVFVPCVNDKVPSESEMYYTLEKGPLQHKAVQYDVEDIRENDSATILIPTTHNLNSDTYFTLERQPALNSCCPYCSPTPSVNTIDRSLSAPPKRTIIAMDDDNAASAKCRFKESDEDETYARACEIDIYDHISRNTISIEKSEDSTLHFKSSL